MRKVMLAGFLAFAYVLPESAGAAELKQETTEAFNQYVRITEDRMTEGMREGRTFLWVDTFPELQRDKLYTQLRQGNIVIEQLETLENEKPIRLHANCRVGKPGSIGRTGKTHRQRSWLSVAAE